MNEQRRMSPWTALFFGFFGLGIAMVASATAVTIHGLQVIDQRVDKVLGLVDRTLEDLPELISNIPGFIESLPPVANELLGQRALDYRSNIDVAVEFVPGGSRRGMVPSVSITNNGDETITLLTIRVAALDANGVARGEWTEVVATPLAFDRDWRGPLLPGSTRHVVLRSRSGIPDTDAKITAAHEISEIRVWQADSERATKKVSMPTT